jgi:5-formyltetrahydrofolate cyclo-ligase
VIEVIHEDTMGDLADEAAEARQSNPSSSVKTAKARTPRAKSPKSSRSSKTKAAAESPASPEGPKVLTSAERKQFQRRRLTEQLEQRWGSIADGVSRPALTVAAERAIVQRLSQALADESGPWAAYRAHRFEPQIDRLFELTPQIRWVFPRVEGRALMFFAPLSRNSFLVNEHGLLEPDPSQSRRVDVMDLRGLIVPGVAFDHAGFRLGRGGGYYDRLFEHFAQLGGEPPYSLGVGFDDQLHDEKIPTESHDRSLDGILTDRRAIGRFFEERDLK